MGRKILVGMLLLGALLVFALGTFYIENLQYYLQALTGKKGYHLIARFNTAQNLDEGDVVRLLGVEVGRVQDLSVEEGPAPKPVMALLWIEEGVKVHADDLAYIETPGIFGGSYMAISRGDPNAPVLHDFQEITNTKVQPTIAQVIAKADSALDDAGRAFADAAEVIEDVKKVARRLEKGEGFLGGLLVDTESYADVGATIESAKKAFDSIEKFAADVREGNGLASRLINDEQLAQDVEAFAADAKTVAGDLKTLLSDLADGKGTAGMLLKDEDLYKRINDAFTQGSDAFAKLQEIANDVRDGEGILPKLLTDTQMAEDLEQMAQDAKAFTSELARLSTDLEGSSIGKLMADDEAYQKLTEVLDELKSSAEAIREKKGTFGLLIHDDKLHKQLSGALESVQKLLDEYREQSPILTAAGAIFGAL